jgi:hypothetical protein
MRRTASETIRSLEARIAQLEGKASRKASDIDPRIQNPGVHLFWYSTHKPDHERK